MAQTIIGKVSIIPCGEFQTNTKYSRLSVVSYEGSSYIAVSDNENVPVTDASVWYLLASKGDQGIQGIQGPQGEQGDTYEVTEQDLQNIANQITADASSAFNQNVTEKTNDFNSNATAKTTAFNGNATDKTTDFNTNYTNKLNSFNSNAETYGKHIQALEDNFDVATSSNSNNYTITDSATGFTKNIKIGDGPELEQFTTTGKNLLSLKNNLSEQTINDVTFTPVFKNGLLEYINVNGTSTGICWYILNQSLTLEPGTYTISDKSNQNVARIYSTGLGRYSENTITTSETTDGNVSINVPSGVTINNVKIYPMIEQSSTATSYEPYTGGQPSPNPDYPQDIVVIEGSSTVNVSNRNLTNGINQDIFINQFVNTCGYAMGNSGLIIPTNGYSNFTISTVVTQTRYRVACVDSIPTSGSDVTAYNGVNKDGTSDTITINTAGHKYLAINATDLSKIQVEKGSTATSYVPHKGNIFPIALPTGMFLGKIGTASNYIYGTRDNWKLHNEIDKFIVDGTENITTRSNTSTTHTKFVLANILSRNILNASSMICNHFKINTLANTTDYSENAMCSSNASDYKKYLYISIENTKASTVAELQAWLSENNITGYYVAESSITADITDSTLVAQLNNILDNLQTYKGGTVVFTTSDNLEPNIQFDYMVNPFATIEARLDLLEA